MSPGSTRAVRSVVVLSGAGLSADSGLPTFRGAGGLWEGQRVEDVATPEAWARDPARVWRFYQLRRAALRDAQPNAAHTPVFQSIPRGTSGQALMPTAAGRTACQISM